jgi:protein phosphatase
LVRPSIVLLCGPAACGKSTFAQHHFRPTQIISSDWARARVCDDERDQRYQAQAFELVHFLTELRLRVNRLCVVDSTALTAGHRKEYLNLARKFHVPCVVFLFDVPLEKCIERDRLRERTVGSAVIERQYLAFGQTKAEIRQEGFDEIIEVGDQDADKIPIEIIFRPIPQLPGTPGRRAQGEKPNNARSWRQGTGREPGVREAQPPSPTTSEQTKVPTEPLPSHPQNSGPRSPTPAGEAGAPPAASAIKP